MRETPFGQVRAVGFDLDDTLCVYMPVAVQARRVMMERYLAPQTGLPIETLDQHYKRAFHSVLENCTRSGGIRSICGRGARRARRPSAASWRA
jgi:FMN phosphatase YigB (HAD superfamily)